MRSESVQDVVAGTPDMRLSRLARWAAGTTLADATVVIVDDSSINVMLLEHHLASMGVSRIHVVNDAREAVDTCLEVRPDVLLLDLHMPHRDGIAVLEELHARLPRGDFLPVLMLTADVSSESREAALNAGANDFLTKPFDRIEVLQRVRNLVEMRALYEGVRHQNRDLQERLDHELAQRRTAAAELERMAQRVADVLANGALSVVFQPIVELDTGTVVAREALARFDAEPRRSPDQWFAEASLVGQGRQLELAAVATALGRLDELPTGQRISLNVSPETLATAEFTDLIGGVDGQRLIVELTESTKVDDYAAVLESIDVLRAGGVQIAVDDAGAGYAGLQHIVRLRPDVIKLDRSMIHGIDRDPVRRALATSIVSFGRDTGSTIVAEGIEEAAELETLCELGVTWGQGYLLGRPAPLEPEALDA